MNFFDQTIISFFNQFARHSITFDLIAASFREIGILKGGVLSVIFCYLWFEDDVQQMNIRTTLISTLFACLTSVLIARIAALTLPYRPRPVLETYLNFVSPYAMNKAWFEDVSAFPSDHAALYSAFAIGLYYASKKVGFWAIIYTALFIFLPRIYEGMHHPTDILAGILIGLISLHLTQSAWFVQRVSTKVLGYSNQYKGFFYAILFMLIYQISALFLDLRHVARLFIDIYRNF